MSVSERSKASSARSIELDILRGFAILLVLGLHSPGERGASGVLRPLDGFLHQFGWTGVDLFFVLSGFLIGRLLFLEIQAHGALDVKRFLVRRAFRIWPGYYAFLLFAVIRDAFRLQGGLGESFQSMLPAFVHLQNFIGVPREHLWTLAVEEHFYLALPFLLAYLARKMATRLTVHAVPYICLAISLTCLAVRIVLKLNTDVDIRALFSMDALFFGVYLAYLSVYHAGVLRTIASYRKTIFVVSALLLAPALYPNAAFRFTVAVTCIYLGYGLLLVTFVHALPGRDIVEQFKSTSLARLVAVIGTYSFSIYLWHIDAGYPVYEVTRDFGRSLGLPGELTWLLHTAGFMIGAILPGVAMSLLIEGPALRVRERLFPSRHGNVGTIVERKTAPEPLKEPSPNGAQ
jgi:peptidoglycan/LPS O-acetylase OafA/YrhL